MTDDLDLVVTANMLRTAIRAKLGSGATQRAIWGLIARYARDGAHTRKREEAGFIGCLLRSSRMSSVPRFSMP